MESGQPARFVRHRMTRLPQPDHRCRSGVSVLDAHRTRSDPVAQHLFHSLRHRRPGLARADHDHAAIARQGIVLPIDAQHVSLALQVCPHRLSGIRRVQSGIHDSHYLAAALAAGSSALAERQVKVSHAWHLLAVCGATKARRLSGSSEGPKARARMRLLALGEISVCFPCLRVGARELLALRVALQPAVEVGAAEPPRPADLDGRNLAVLSPGVDRRLLELQVLRDLLHVEKRFLAHSPPPLPMQPARSCGPTTSPGAATGQKRHTPGQNHPHLTETTETPS